MAILEFYRENIKFSLKALYYRFIIYLIFSLPLFAIMALSVFLLSKISAKLSNIALVSMIASILLFALYVLFGFFLRFLYITGYSLLREQEESKEYIEILYKVYRAFTSWKFVLKLVVMLFVLVTIGSVISLYVLPESLDLYRSLKQGLVVGIKLLLTVIALAVILGAGYLVLLFFMKWKIVRRLLKSLFGKLLKILALVIVLAGLYFAVTLIYSRLSLMLDPILYSMFGIPF